MPLDFFLNNIMVHAFNIQPPVIIDDEDEGDFQDPASLKAKRNGRTAAAAASKRKRARIQDDSDGILLYIPIFLD